MIGKHPNVLESLKFPLVLIFAGSVLSVTLAWATSEPLIVSGVKQPNTSVDALIRSLADDSFSVREEASQKIWSMGEAAMPALRQALLLSDPEQVFRTRDLIRKIELQIKPTTDPVVLDVVDRYPNASATEKTSLLAKLRVNRAWRQMLKLYAGETDAAVREKLQPLVDGIALKAARESLAVGADQEAREFLELAPADAEGLLALAEFHRSHGSLDAELKRARTIPGRKSQAWQLALQRAAGNLDVARDAAIACGELRIAATMAALAGDPLPWLRLIPDRQAELEPDSMGPAYASIAIKRWHGNAIRTQDLQALVHPLSARNIAERIAPMNALFLLGEVDLAEAAFAKAMPLDAFLHFQSLERISDALHALGLTAELPAYQAWVEKRFARLSANDIEDQHAPSQDSEELIAFANFLERKGLHDDAWAAFSDPAAVFAKKDTQRFVNFLAILFGSRERPLGAPLLARRLAISWASNNDGGWDKIIAAAFGDDAQSIASWDWLAELDPSSTCIERFDAMLALRRLVPDPSQVRNKWMTLAWKAVAAAAPDKRDHHVAHISALAIQSGDVTNSLKAWDLLPDSARKAVFWGELILHLSAADRWNDAAALILNQIAIASQTQQEPSAQFHAYAAACLRQAGRLDDAAAHDRTVDQLALGNANVAIQIATGYEFGCDYQRAAVWWARAARQADPDSQAFLIALKHHSDIMLEDGQWKVAAATSEVLARICASSGNGEANPLTLMHHRLQADMARALANLHDERAPSIALLEKCHHAFASDGTLADFFFPALRKAGLLKEHDEWFQKSWTLMEKVIEQYPQSDNTRNTAAWFASRAGAKLDQAEAQLVKALAANPTQAAYLDTMAEIQFAKGKREKAIEWSHKAIDVLPDDPQLRRQHERFRSEALHK